MARWQLMEKHYLNVPGTEWEKKETSETTGKQVRKIFPVPLYLDPDSEEDRNYDGMIVVSDGNNSMPRDIIFEGIPGPDMFPLDAEAEAISAQYAKSWEIKPDTFQIAEPVHSASDPVILALQQQVATLTALLSNQLGERRV